jgi:DnaJ-class molecular chaperone
MLGGMARPRFDRDYYRIMGLGPEATEDEVRRTYRRLALQWHPDRNPGNPEAGERFKEISEAYAVLIDPDRRRRYDRARRAGVPADFAPSREDLFRDLFADARASAIFDELARELERMGVRVSQRDFHETLFGGRAVVTGRVVVVTPFALAPTLFRLARAIARGARAVPPGEASRTPVEAPRGGGLLAGLGRAVRWFLGVPAAPEALPGVEDDLVLPLALSAEEAARGGRRRVAVGDGDVLVTIPRGVRAGTRLRLRGRGRPRGDGSRGDAYLVVTLTGSA